MSGLARLKVALSAPARVDYDPASLGIAAHYVSIRLENRGPEPIPVTHLHASFSCARQGVAFPCNAHVGQTADAIEPARIDPGQSFAYERRLDCEMPLPGRYDVTVWIHPGEGEDEHEARGGGASLATPEPDTRAGQGVYAGSFDLDVVAADGNEPHAVPSRPGLFAIMIAATTAAPMKPADWVRGGYRAVVALINGGNRPIAVGPAYVSIVVFKRGESTPCTGKREPLEAPPDLRPGMLYTARVPVTCAPKVEGQYEIVGRLKLEPMTDVEIGRIGLLVTENPYFQLTPRSPFEPWSAP